MMNRNEIPAAEAKIKAEIAKRGTPECKEVEALIDTYTGPATGLVWDEGAEKLDDVTGAGTGMVYKDGKLVPAE